MGTRDAVILLHGLGVGPESWRAQVDVLETGMTTLAPPIVGLADGEPSFTTTDAAGDVIRRLNERGIRRAHFCGLSLGAMIALQVAVEYPERVASLVLSGGQVRPPRALMAVQSAVMRLLPARVVTPNGMSKQRVLNVLREVSHIDFGPHLGDITVPVLVLCGSRDAANLPAARALAAGIPGARLRIIDGGGHELNTGKPDEFTAELSAFLRSITAE